MKRINEVVKMTEEQVNEILGQELSKSAKIKALFDGGYEVKEIASIVGVRYNFVYNVVSNYVVINGIETENVKRDSKKDAVWAMFDRGMKLMEVAKELKTNYNYVWKLHKEWEQAAIKEAAVGEVK